MARDMGNKYLEGMALRLLGLVSKERGMLDRAEDFLKKAESVLSQKDDPYILAITYGALGSLYRETNNYDLSEKYLNQALETSSNLTNGQEITSVFLSKLTKLYIYKADQKSLARAEELNKKALSISKQLDRQIGIAYCKLNYGLIAKKRNDNENALSYADEAEGLFVRYGSKEDIARELKYLTSEN
jgi:tetratricopeptide (TPR) repeat protein